MATTYELAVKIAGKLDSTFGQSFMSATATLQKHQEKIAGVRKSLKELEEAHKQGKISTEEYAASYAKLSQQLDKAKAAQERLAKAVNFQKSMEEKASAAGGKLLRSTALMTAALAGPVVAAMNFESSMADVRKVIDFETPEQFKKMGEDILSLTKRIPMTARGLADIVAAAGQAGVARDELLAFAESAAKMGVAFDITAEQAGQMMAQWRTAFKMSQKEVNELADQINYLGNTTAASAPKISDIVTKIGPLGEIGGVAAREIVALGATIGSVGIQEEVAATGIKNLVLRLNSGASATDRQKKAFKSLGLSATKLAKAMQKDASGAILSVIEALGKIPEYKRTAILTDLFGRESVAAIAPLITNIDKLRENLQKVGDATQYQGSMEKEFEERSKTTANAIRILANYINILSVNLGSVLLPPLAATAERLSGVSDKIAKWTKAHPKLTKVLVLGTAGMLAFNVAVHAMEFVVFSGLAKLAKLYVFLVKHNAATKIATVSTKAFSLAQKGLRAVLSLSAGALHAMPIVAYRAKVVAVAAATKLWAAAQVAFNLAIKLGTSLLSVARLAAYTVAVKGIAIATKAWAAIQWLLNAALSANPIGLVVVAVAGLVAGLTILYKKSETVRAIINTLWDVIGAGPRAIVAVIGKLWDFISVLGKIKIPDVSLMPKIVWDVAKFPLEVISAIPEKIMDIMGKIKLPDIWWPFESAAIGAFRAVKEKTSGLIAFLNNIAPISSLGKILDALASGAANAYSFVMDKFSQLLSYLSAIRWPESLGHLWNILISSGASAYNFIVEKMDALISFLGGVIWPTSLGSLWDIITSGATSMFQTVINALNWVIDKVNWFIDKLNKIKLPSWLPIVGGKGVNIQMIEQIKSPTAVPAPAPVPGHAEGGIFSTPHLAMVAEKGPEAILPMDKLLAAMREGGAKAAAPSINITYSPASPVINVYGQGEMNAEQIRSEVLRAERKAQEEFEARLKAFLAQQGRLSYA